MPTSSNLQSQRFTNNSNTYTINYAVSPGSDRVLAVRVVGQRGSMSDFTLSATFNSVSMSQAATAARSGTSRWWRASIFYLIAPAEITADVVITASSSLMGAVVSVETLHGAAQSSVIGAFDSVDDNAADVSVSLLACASNSLILAVVGSNAQSAPTWSWVGASEDYEQTGATDTAEMASAGASYETSGGDVAITATRSNSNNQVMAAAEFLATPVGGITIPLYVHHMRQQGMM